MGLGGAGDAGGAVGDVAGVVGSAVGVGDVPPEVGVPGGVALDEPAGDGVVLLGGADGDGELLPEGLRVGDAVGDADGDAVCEGCRVGASSRIATISALNPSSWAEISASEYDVMVCPNSVSRSQTSARATSCSSLGVWFTEKTSWLAMAAVMHR